MPRFAANLTMLFTEVLFLDRFAAAACRADPTWYFRAARK